MKVYTDKLTNEISVGDVNILNLKKMCDDISSTHGFVDDELAEKLSGMGDACVYRTC